MLDTADWPVVFLGAIKAGIVPVALNTLLTARTTNTCCPTAGAKALFVSEALLTHFEPILDGLPFLKHVIVSGSSFNDLLAKAARSSQPAPTTRDDICFWLYSSGSTGAPKGTVHLHSHLIVTAELYAQAACSASGVGRRCSPRRSSSSPTAWAMR